MSFWSDASGATKGIIVVGGLLVLVGLVYLLMPEPEQAQQRGIRGGEGVAAEKAAE
jgi:hypothetical protein